MTMAVAGNTVAATNVPSFDVPSFDYNQLQEGSTPQQVLDALKQNGIISLKNVPSYAQARQDYLTNAASCAVVAEKSNAGFLLQKTLSDDTKRYTISTPSGQALDTSAMETDKACPGYAKVYESFTSTMELAMSKLASSLDKTSFSTTDGYSQVVSARKMFGEAVRLDHFHAYEAAPATKTEGSSTDKMSLEMHEDQGMFIAFATPAFYKVNGDGKSVQQTSIGGDDEAGLVIKTQDGKVVRPALKDDEVTVMVGTGFNKWVKTSEKLPPVTHAMQMPKVETKEGERLLRAWFGKMTLLPSYQRMLSDVTFEEHANTTKRFLQDSASADQLPLGCASGRRLVASAAE
ncbi:TPA: hypothetical protein N0F65_004397 [Lagenidium giganteum]|uniref:Uncharacterized protein n=1 Tax=Lagenidium giganteum TaxID=4803 RepID=A0AAV2ZNR1_9STRA|nr:TPA: hypothetical protein N0F65_004397 [Lagenidium giganteum]